MEVVLTVLGLTDDNVRGGSESSRDAVRRLVGLLQPVHQCKPEFGKRKEKVWKTTHPHTRT